MDRVHGCIIFSASSGGFEYGLEEGKDVLRAMHAKQPQHRRQVMHMFTCVFLFSLANFSGALVEVWAAPARVEGN